MKYKYEIFSFLKNNNIKFIDLDVEIKRYEEDLINVYPLKIRSHFNAKGQEIVTRI